MARVVVDRMAALGLNNSRLARQAGVSKTVIGQLVKAENLSYSDATTYDVSQALGWIPSSIRDVLAGGEPTLATPDRAEPLNISLDAFSGDVELLRQRDPEGFADLERMVARLAERYKQQ